jgi:putative peptidoglycan lipid II flippase
VTAATAGRTIARAGIIVSAAFLISRILGWLRVVVIANTFGASKDLDAFFAAFRLPDLMFQLVAAGALGSALIPIVAGLLATGEEARAWRVVSTVANLMLIGLLGLAALVLVFAPAIVPVIAPGFGPVETATTVELTRIMVLSPMFLALGAVATSLLSAKGWFGAASLAPIAYNLAIIGAAVFLAPTLGVVGLAMGVVAGAVCHVLVQLPAVARAGYRYTARIDLADPQARTALTLLVPRALGLAVTQITFLVVTAVASTLGTGAVTAYNVAFSVVQIPLGVIGVPLGIVLFPALSREVALGNEDSFVRLLTRALRLIIFVMLPIAVLATVVRRDVIVLLFGRGFDEGAIDLTSQAMLAFLVGLPAHSLIAVLARAFYARQDTRTPVLAACVSVAVNSTLAIVLSGPLGLAGVSLSIAIGAWVEAGILLVLIDRRVPALSFRPLGEVAIRTGIASGVAFVASFLVQLALTPPAPDERIAALVRLTVVGAVGGVAFVAAAAALRIPELPSIIGVMADVVRRPRQA